MDLVRVFISAAAQRLRVVVVVGTTDAFLQELPSAIKGIQIRYVAPTTATATVTAAVALCRDDKAAPSFPPPPLSTISWVGSVLHRSCTTCRIETHHLATYNIETYRIETYRNL